MGVIISFYISFYFVICYYYDILDVAGNYGCGIVQVSAFLWKTFLPAMRVVRPLYVYACFFMSFYCTISH